MRKSPFAFRLTLTALALATALMPGALAQSTIKADAKHVYGANIGWLDLRATGQEAHGLRVGEYICSGYIYSANVGWINCGDGSAANGIQYSNTSNTDFGLNVVGDGRLSGYAYGANIGWIRFDPTIASPPRYNLLNGKLAGYAYGANVGWINLGDGSVHITASIEQIIPGEDTDGDQIADAWERLRAAGNLNTLGAHPADRDGDGESDYQEYLADSNPLDRDSALRITEYVRDTVNLEADITFTSTPTRTYEIFSATDLASFGDTGLPRFVGASPLSAVSVPYKESLEPSKYWQVRSYRPLVQLP